MHSRRLPLGLAAFFWAAILTLPSRATVDDDFAAASVLFNRAQNLEQSGVPKYALSTYNDCYARLQKIRASNPTWNPNKVSKEMAACFAEIGKLGAEVNGKLPAPLPIQPDMAASSPPPSNPPPFQQAKFGLIGSSPHVPGRSYPWKTGIVTTVFWIGENGGSGNERSAWNPHWTRDNGGADDQYDLSGYASAKHASTLNPFYVSLPFNDLAHPDMAARWLPTGWSATSGNKGASTCKDRWVRSRIAPAASASRSGKTLAREQRTTPSMFSATPNLPRVPVSASPPRSRNTWASIHPRSPVGDSSMMRMSSPACGCATSNRLFFSVRCTSGKTARPLPPLPRTDLRQRRRRTRPYYPTRFFTSACTSSHHASRNARRCALIAARSPEASARVKK
jgi:hypothetical protein